MYFTHAKNYLIHRKYPQYFSKNLYIKNYCHLNFQVLSYPINIHGNLVASVCVIPSGYFFSCSRASKHSDRGATKWRRSRWLAVQKNLKVRMAITLDLDIFGRTKYFTVLFYDGVSYISYINRKLFWAWVNPLIVIKFLNYFKKILLTIKK